MELDFGWLVVFLFQKQNVFERKNLDIMVVLNGDIRSLQRYPNLKVAVKKFLLSKID